MEICQKCKQLGEIVKPGLRCKKCVNEYKNEWQRKKKNRQCAKCGCSYIPKANDKECSIKCRILNNIEIRNECWIWKKKIGKSGYGQTKINNQDRLMHRVSYEEYKGQIPKGIHVCHKCDVKACVNPDHLWLGTQKENVQDAKEKKRLSKQPMKKLTNLQVKEIRENLDNGRSQVSLAREFNVSQAVISYIKLGKHYKEG